MIDLMKSLGACGCGDAINAADDAPQDYQCCDSTKLFKAIETQNWDLAIVILKQNPAEATKWVVKKGLGGLGNLKRLPIHEACIHKPNEAMITALIEANPTGAREKDSDGQLPLHHAVENGAPVAVLEQLLLTCPDALDVKNKWGNYPEDIANSTASQEVINVLKKRPSVYAVQAYKKVRTLEEDKVKDEFKKQLQDERVRSINTVKQVRADEIRKSQASINQITKELSKVTTAKDEANEKIAKLKGILVAKEGDMSILKHANTEIYAEKKAADEQIIQLNGINAKLEKEADKLKTDNAKINATVAKLEKEVENLKYAAKEARADELRKSQLSINKVTQTLSRVTAEKQAANKKIFEINDILSAKEEAVKKLKKANSEVYAEKKAADEEIAELRGSVDRLEKKHEKLWIERRKISVKFSSVEKQMEELRVEDERLVKENREYKSKVDRMMKMFQS